MRSRAPSLRSRLLLLVLAAVLPVVLAAAVAIDSAYHEMRAAVLAQAQEAARATMDRVDHQLSRLPGGAHVAAQDEVFATGVSRAVFTGLLPRMAAPEWIVVVFDRAGTIVARSHGIEHLAGRLGAPALIAALQHQAEGHVETVSVDGVPMLATFKRSAASGWAVAVGVPRRVLLGRLQHWLVAASAMLAALAALGAGLAWWLSRRIAGAVHGLVTSAAALGRGEPVTAIATPLALHEADTVADALLNASRLLRQRTRERDAVAQQNIRLTRAVEHDALTGLASRDGFRERLAERLDAQRRAGGALTVFFIDLDDFKPVNDRHGHAVGDALLQACAARLAAGIRESDVAARLGGDEFAVLIDGIAPPAAAGVAEQLIDRLCEPYAIRDERLQVSACIGIAGFPADGDTIDALLEAADGAMYRAKAAGKGGWRRADFAL